MQTVGEQQEVVSEVPPVIPAADHHSMDELSSEIIDSVPDLEIEEWAPQHETPLVDKTLLDNNLIFCNLTRNWGLIGPQKKQLLSWLTNPITNLSDLENSVYRVEQHEKSFFEERLKV